MFEILTIDNSNIFQHFLELAVPLFPIKQVNQTIDVKFIIAGEYVLSIYLLHVPNFEQYKLNAKQKVLQFIDTYKNTLIVFIPNLVRVDEKTNKALLQTFELIYQDLNIGGRLYTREQITKIIFFENALELNKENCMREFISTIRYQINLYVDQNMKFLDSQISEIKEQHSQGEFVSFYKLFNLTCQKAKLYINLKQLPEALKLYFDFEDLFFTQYFDKKLLTFNSLHPFDFVAKKSIQIITQIFEQSGDESQSTVLDFMILIQAKIIDILAVINQTQCLEQILHFSNNSTKVVELHKLEMKKANIPDEEQILDIGHLIWQYVNIKNSLAHVSKYPQNLQGLQLLNFQYQTFKIKSLILNIVEKLGNLLYQINFQYAKSFGIIEQCKLLEDSISGKVSPQISQPNKTMITFLMTDLSLRDSLITLDGFIDFYNNTYQDLISQVEQLQAHKLKFTLQFNLLKLKNIYPELQLSPQILNDIGTKEPPCQDFPQLYASFLIQQMIHMYRENLQMSFKDNFQSAMQSQLPGQCFTNLFKLLNLPLSRMKDVQFGMFEKFVLEERISYYEYLFKFSIIRYLNIECDGQFRITLKNLLTNRKIKLNTLIISLQESKRQNFSINLVINDQEGIYQITKATFSTGSFKLYLIISSRVESQKLQLIYPSIQLYLNKPISNIGTKYLIQLSDIPPNIQQIQIKIVGSQLYHHIQFLEQFKVDKNQDIYDIQGEFQLTNYGILTLISNQKHNNFTIELICQGKSQIQQYEQKGIEIVQIKDLSDQTEDDNQLVEIHMFTENKQIIVASPKGQFILTQDDIRRFHHKRDQVLSIQEQEDLTIFKETSLNEIQIQQLIKFSFDVNFILQIQQNSLEENIQKSKQILFKIQILTVYNQDQGIPFRQQQYYTVALKIRYLGTEKQDYDFVLENMHIKGSKRFSQNFSPQQTIAVHNFQCFLFSIEKPILSIYREGIKLIDSADMDYQMQISDF